MPVLPTPPLKITCAITVKNKKITCATIDISQSKISYKRSEEKRHKKKNVQKTIKRFKTKENITFTGLRKHQNADYYLQGS